jgi:hypothetical protein
MILNMYNQWLTNIKTLVFVFLEDVGHPGLELSGRQDDIEWTAEGETEDLVKKEVIFGCFLFVCMSLHISVWSHGSL